MPFFAKVFKGKDGAKGSSRRTKNAGPDDGGPVVPPKPKWDDAWTRKDVAPEEIQELVHVCTQEMKSRALDMPFLLLPFRPNADHIAARSFIRNFFKTQFDGGSQYTIERLQKELLLTEPLVLCSIMKWCWSRMPNGVVGWEAYQLFRIGEQDSNIARHAFHTFIPLSVESDAKKQIIFDFFDLLAAVAARGKTNGLGGRKLSRLAGWWAFDHSDDGKGFDGGYKSWSKAADATSHLFFAYLRSLSPESDGMSGLSQLPRSLQALLSQTEYPPETPALMLSTTTKVVMIVDSVSPTPFSLLRRTKNFNYRDDDEGLQRFSSYEDPVQALTNECRRVLQLIARTNQSVASGDSAVQDASWSRFEDTGFSGLLDGAPTPANGSARGPSTFNGLNSQASSRLNDLGRPTTPSWADFLSSGFGDDVGKQNRPVLLSPDKVLPPIGEAARVQSSQSHMRNGAQVENLEPGELASITAFDLDETFWWVWMTSLAGEETTDRKAVFGRCLLIETEISNARWMVVEEQVKGAAARPEEGAYIAEKKGFFSFTRRGRLGRRKSTGKKAPTPTPDPYPRSKSTTEMMSKTSIAPDQQAKIQQAAADLARSQRAADSVERRGRTDDATSTKTNSVMTLQPAIMSEAAPAMKWAKEFDKGTIRAKYLGDMSAGRGLPMSQSTPYLGTRTSSMLDIESPKSTNRAMSPELADRELPAVPREAARPEVPVKETQPPPAPLPPTPPAVAEKTASEELAKPEPLKPEPSSRFESARAVFSKIESAKNEPLKPESPKVESPKAQSPRVQTSVPSRVPVPKAQTPRAESSGVESPRTEVAKAAKVPLPPDALDEKPAQSSGDLDEHPAFRDQHPAFRTPRKDQPVAHEPQSPAEEAARRAWERIPVSEPPAPAPAAKKSPPRKLRKQEGGGLRKFFGRKKDQESAKPVEKPQARESRLAPSPAVEEDQPAPTYTMEEERAPVADEGKPDPVVARSPVIDQSPAVSAVSNGYASKTPAPAAETSEAQADFSRFNQGPLDDVPAFVPDDITDDELERKPAATSREAPKEPLISPTDAYADPHPTRSRESSVSALEPEEERKPRPADSADDGDDGDELTRQVSPSQDRWAQIRKNAAERAAKYNAEQHSSRPSYSKTDDGDTSGEETIESRVARIKARVAELTGSMDAQGNIRTQPK